MIDITGKVVGMGYLDKNISFKAIRAGGAPSYIDIRPDGASKPVRVRTNHGTDVYNAAMQAQLAWTDFRFQGDLA